MPTLQNGVSVLGSRWGGVSLFCARFALALRSLSRLRLFLFEARLSGYCVRGGESRDLGSSCLPLARGSCRAVGFRQDECRPGASAWACCLWFVALLHVVVHFRAVHRCCVLGCGFPLKISLWLSCLHCVGFQQFGGSGRGILSRGLLAASGSCNTSCSSCFADASERGVSPRLEVGGSACVAPALRSLSRLRLLLFEARLSGSCVREGESRDLGS